MRRELRVAIKLGLYAGLVGVLFALPTLSGAYRVWSALAGPTAWPEIVENAVPAVLFAAIGGLAARRNLSPSVLGFVVGLMYGGMQGLALYLIAAATPYKTALADRLWQAWVAAGRPASLTARTLVEAPILHPSPTAYIGGDMVQMAVVGVIAGIIGAALVRRTPGPSSDQAGYRSNPPR
ncbi:MAG: hypothetical protein K6V97_04885 [Actinomycetia bacterium]|nr:hypothetical protein [Actinomycetes bacterium]